MQANDFAVHTEHLTKIYTDFWGRPKVGAGRPEPDDPSRRGVRPARAQRLGQKHHDQAAARPDLRHARQGHHPRPAVGSTAINEKIGFLPEESYLYRFLNGEETLKFYGRLFKIPSRDLKKRVPELLDIVGLDQKSRKRKLREYSKGMARRIGLAQALINNPDLILLDEPTTGLDPIGTREMKDLILSLKNQGKTVLLCSHLLADVQDVCDRITILFRGKMMELGYVKDLLQVKDVTQISTRGLVDGQITELKDFLNRMGAKDAQVSHPTTTLEDLFVRIVRENTPGGGSYTSSS